jgi:peptide/nickel transport system permease protein
MKAPAAPVPGDSAVAATHRDRRVRRPRSLVGILGDRRVQLGLALTIPVLLIAFLGPMLAPHSSTDFVGPPYSGPSGAAPLGTDYLGRDVFSRLLVGGASLVWMSVAATTIGVIVGAAVGITAGYIGRRLGGFMMRVMDVLLAFPYIVLVLLFVSVIGSKLWLLVLMVALAWIPAVARVAQGVTHDIARQEYVQAADAIGVSRRAIISREILPNLATPLLVQYGQYLTWSIGLIAGLSFLGFGVQPPATDWGVMVNENRTGLATQPWGVLAPILLIAAFTIGTNLIAEGYSRRLANIEGSGDPS